MLYLNIVKPEMALWGFKTGNATFPKDTIEVGSINFVHKCIHEKICCGVSSHNSQKEHLHWEIIPK